MIVIEKEDSKVYATASEAIPSAESTDFKIEVSQAEVDRTNVDGSFEQGALRLVLSRYRSVLLSCLK